MSLTNFTETASMTRASRSSSGSNLTPTRVVIHGTVSRCQLGGAQATANGFAQPKAGGSAHLITDPGAVVRSLPDNVIAWHAPPNPRSLGVEMTDPVIWQSYPTANAGQIDPRFKNDEATFHARWSLPDYQQMLARTALVVAEWCDKYGIPKVRISVADLKAGARGICGHRDVSFAFGQSNHVDPYAGDNAIGDFPWDQFIGLVNDPYKALAILGGAEGDDEVGNVDTISDAAADKIADRILARNVAHIANDGTVDKQVNLGMMLGWLDNILLMQVPDAILRKEVPYIDPLTGEVSETKKQSLQNFLGWWERVTVGNAQDAAGKVIAELKSAGVQVTDDAAPVVARTLMAFAAPSGDAVEQLPEPAGVGFDPQAEPSGETASGVHGAGDTESHEG